MDTQAYKGGLRVLAVDDEKNVLDLYRQVLSPDMSKTEAGGRLEQLAMKLYGDNLKDVRKDNVDLVVCSRGDTAVEEVRNAINEGNPYAVVFLDMRMPPGPDGLWAAEQIRSIDPSVTIIIVTAYSDVDPRAIEGRVPPPDKLLYIQKPITSPEIRQFVSSMGKKWMVEKELAEIHDYLKAQFGEAIVEIIALQNKYNETAARLEAAGKARARNERALLSAIENGSRLVFKTDIETGEFVHVGDECEKLTGYSAVELLGKRTDDFIARIHPDDKDAYIDARSTGEESNGRGNSPVTFRWERKDGEWITLRESRFALMADDGEPGALLSMVEVEG
jgi:two-component system cell cycle sensor histidine kinase/response regulator CckA